jgi:dihydroanticapsin dehydrogenase
MRKAKDRMTNIEGQLVGKKALITGAGVGIGKAIALRFAQEGAGVAVHVNRSLENGLQVVQEITHNKGKAILVQGDLTKKQEIEAIVRKATSELGNIDILVYNSGIGTQHSPDMVHTITEEDWDTVLSVNLKAFVFLSQMLLPAMMQAGKGSIITISSIRGLLGNPVLASYCASKGGMVLLTKQMALDYAKYNIRVNCICPGFIDTEMFRFYLGKQSDPEASRRVFAGMAAMNRIGRPEEIAASAVFFASDVSSFVTGVALPVDGGYTANGVREIQ